MNNEAIKEINQHIREWSDIMLKADLWAYELNYTDEDLLALYIFNHVAQNVAIKSGFLNEKMLLQRWMRFAS